MEKTPSQIDSLLEPLLLTVDDEDADGFLSQLIVEHAAPVINGVIRYKLRLGYGGAEAEAEDLRQEAIALLLAELQKLRADKDAHPIRDLRGLAATITYRLCARWMRRQFPRQQAFRNRIQYLLTRQSGFALWSLKSDEKNESKKLIAGFAAWRGQSPYTGRGGEAASLSRLSQDKRLFDSLGGGGGSAKLNEALATIFNHVGGPIELEDLVKTLAVLLQITDPVIESIDADSGGAGFELEDKEPDVSWRVEKRIFLQRLWEEVRQLPRQQRVALLLNLRDSEGRGCIALFPATGVATLRQLAAALEIGAEKLAEIWNELPLEDARIAEMLLLTRQQVINARKSARERLARRLKGFF